ncbi:hypothetical protein BDV95DRAFT_43533 [Massariosphaeria phaeospora]|uniref:Uncharacterized protein n=1 Tax=Massariosphaeria phaeospora TaxID=100035 RepID=A0A7C8I5U8_9PLEO|nr:hypothetical protein BDV95DRAFT_43533 [Massariosphaeria phaeospora]
MWLAASLGSRVALRGRVTHLALICAFRQHPSESKLSSLPCGLYTTPTAQVQHSFDTGGLAAALSVDAQRRRRPRDAWHRTDREETRVNGMLTNMCGKSMALRLTYALSHLLFLSHRARVRYHVDSGRAQLHLASTTLVNREELRPDQPYGFSCFDND